MIYKNEYTKEISFPLGGIGSGSIGIGGDGRLRDWEIFNRPSKGSFNGYSHFAAKAVNKSGICTKVLNGDIFDDFAGEGNGTGALWCKMSGFPHFKNVKFDGQFPIAVLSFADKNFPADIKLTAFNPFIPLDEKNSSIPGAFFSVEFTNTSNEETEYTVAFSLANPFENSKNVKQHKNGFSMVTLSDEKLSKKDLQYADLTIATDSKDADIQTYWYRGGWRDPIVTYWNEFSSTKNLQDRDYDTCGKNDTCTIAVRMTLKPKETRAAKFVLSWNAPNNYNYWKEYKDENGNHKGWKNYYATVFETSMDSAVYSLENFNSLYERTLKFKDTLFSSTLDDKIINAISANLSVLKSPTVLRLEDGSFYGWEGVYEKDGSCEGTCQHVWNYAYALCFLFPKLERSIRDIEFKYCMDENGRTAFRASLPLGREKNDFRACLDGQMGTVIKVFREWKISGDDDWLKSRWEDVKNILEYAWSKENPDRWDLNKDGILEGRQHHTLDMELFGPSAWLQGIYLAALKAAEKMALYLNDTEKAAEYESIFKSGYNYTKDNLFNGKYFIQKIDINDRSILKSFDAEDGYWNFEKNEIKYQIGDGCEIDQMLGQWHADIVGLGEIFDKQQMDTALRNLYKNNFKKNVREFVNPWRVFTVNDEAGTIMCDYPEDAKKPFIPVPYCEETMGGFEYSLAGLLIKNGYINEGTEIVNAVREKYDGKKRNPWNEIECGNNYARSMASFAMLPLFAGFDYNLSEGYVGFNPIINKENFRCLWSLGTGWGEFILSHNKAEIKVCEGFLKLSKINIPFIKKINTLIINGDICSFNFDGVDVNFEEKIIKSVVISYE